jgi:hypothetical protein
MKKVNNFVWFFCIGKGEYIHNYSQAIHTLSNLRSRIDIVPSSLPDANIQLANLLGTMKYNMMRYEMEIELMEHQKSML